MRKGHASAPAVSPVPVLPRQNHLNAVLKDPAPASAAASAASASAQTPERKGQRFRQIISPTTYAIAFTAPNEKLLKRVKFLATASNPGLAAEVHKVIFSIYYTLLERQGEPASVGILGAVIAERRDQKPVKGQYHDIKAASFFNVVHKVIGKLKSYLDVATDNLKQNILREYYEYLKLQADCMQSELKKLPVAKKTKVKEAVKKNLRELLDKSPQPRTAKQKELALRYHDEKLTDTPRKLTARSKAIRAQAQKIAQEMDQIVRGDLPEPQLDQMTPPVKKKAPEILQRKRKIAFPAFPTSAIGDQAAAADSAAADAKASSENPANVASVNPGDSAAGPVAAPQATLQSLPEPAQRKAVSFSFKKPSAAAALDAAVVADEIKLSKMTSFFRKIEAVDRGKRRKTELQAMKDKITNEAAAAGLEITPPVLSGN